jgi:two-component system response regulator YesN
MTVGDDFMYNVIIVEDELLVRMGLKHSIDWNGHGMSVIGDFSDAVVRVHTFFKQNKVDIVITDIKMPCMDGIEADRENPSESMPDAAY